MSRMSGVFDARIELKEAEKAFSQEERLRIQLALVSC